MAVNLNGKLLLVKDIDVQSPSARGASTLYKMRFSDVRTGLKVEERFKGDENLDTITLTRRAVNFSYIDGDEYVFMDDEDYTPYNFKKEQIEDELLFIPEGGMPGMQVLTMEGQLLALELPQTVDMEIVDTAPSIKGASASARNKPAIMSTGLSIQVPEYISPGEKFVFILLNAAIWAALTNPPSSLTLQVCWLLLLAALLQLESIGSLYVKSRKPALNGYLFTDRAKLLLQLGEKCPFQCQFHTTNFCQPFQTPNCRVARIGFLVQIVQHLMTMVRTHRYWTHIPQ